MGAIATLFTVIEAEKGLAAEGEPVKINLLGDSIMADQPPQRAIQGWGTYLKDYLSNAMITNFASSGRSSKSYMEGDVTTEGSLASPAMWGKVKEAPADYWIISFGANDAKPLPDPRHTDPEGDFSSCLSSYIKEARSRGAKPVLITPLHRRFNKAGRLPEDLKPYADAMRQVAEKEGVPVIDLYGFTKKWFLELGPDGLRQFGPPDLGGHLNKEGARIVAAEMARQFSEIEPRVAKSPSY